MDEYPITPRNDAPWSGACAEIRTTCTCPAGAPKPVARLLHWVGEKGLAPSVAARTYEEFSEAAASASKVWHEGAPLYASRRDLGPSCTCPALPCPVHLAPSPNKMHPDAAFRTEYVPCCRNTDCTKCHGRGGFNQAKL